MTHGQQSLRPRNARLPRAIETLARYWTSATQAQRFALVKASLEGWDGAPSYRELQIAIYLAEVEAGEVAEG